MESVQTQQANPEQPANNMAMGETQTPVNPPVQNKNNSSRALLLAVLIMALCLCSGVFVFWVINYAAVDGFGGPEPPEGFYNNIIDPIQIETLDETPDDVQPTVAEDADQDFSFELYFGSGANRSFSTVSGMMPNDAVVDEEENPEDNVVTISNDEFEMTFSMFYEGAVGPYEERVDIDDTNIDLLRIRTANESRYEYVNKDQFFEEDDFCNAPVYGDPPAPCGSDVLYVESDNLILNVYCTHNSDEGLAQCDMIMKDISIVKN